MDSILIYLLFQEILITIQVIYIGISIFVKLNLDQNDNYVIFMTIIVISSLILLLRLISYISYLPIQKYIEILGQAINILQMIAIYLCIQYQIVLIIFRYKAKSLLTGQVLISIFLRRENSFSSQSLIIVLQTIAFIMTIAMNEKLRDQTVFLILDCALILVNALFILIKHYCLAQKEPKITSKRFKLPSQCLSEVQLDIDFCVSLKDARILVVNNQGTLMYDNCDLRQFLFEQDKMSNSDLISTFLEVVQTSNQDEIMNLFQYISQDPDKIPKHRCFTFMKNNYFDFEDIQIIVYHKCDQEYFIIQFIKIDQNKQSEQSDIQMIDLCRSLSHELVTNLNSISTFSLLAMNESKISESVKVDYLVPILINTDQLQLIVNNIRDFNLISLGQFNLKVEDIDIQLEIQNICQLFEPSLKSKKIRLIQDFKQCANKMIQNDRQRLRQIVFQLMQNAVKYTLQGFIKIEVECDHTLVRISILDTGIGLKQEEYEKMQLLLNKNKLIKISNNSVGAGIGLSISNMIVLQMNDLKLPIKCNLTSEGTQFTLFVKNYHKIGHKRSLDFKSSRQTIKILSNNSYQEGSDFIRSQSSKKSIQVQVSLRQKTESINQYSFPQFEDEDLQTHIIQAPPMLVPKFQKDKDQQIDYQSLKSKCCNKVLIVDDEYFNILCLEMILIKVNVKCDHAYNGSEALSKIYMLMNDPCKTCANNHYQLIFLDINMPLLDGFKTVKEIKKLIHQKIISKAICVANTGFCDLQTRVQAFEAGMDYFLTKPIDQQTVIDILQGFR